MFSAVISYLGLFLIFFFLPGFFITVILRLKKFRFLLSFAFSYSLLVLILLPFEYYGGSVAGWEWCVFLVWVVLAVWAVVKIFTDKNSKMAGTALRAVRNRMPQTQASPKAPPRRGGIPTLIHWLLSPRLLVPFALAGVICGYLAWAGPYLEIPSDVWEHVRRFQWIKSGALTQGFFASGSSFADLLTVRLRWYFFHPWLCRLSGLPLMDSFNVLTFVNVLVFLLAMYYFGLFLFAGLRASALKKMIMAAFASLFAAVTMGNIVFAYIRYYAFAPAILNYVLFLAAMAVVVAWLRSDRWFGHALWIVPMLLIATSLIHAQEALFIFFMTLALGLVETIRIFWRKIFRPAKQVICSAHWTPRAWKTVILAAVLLVVFFAGFAALRHFRPGAWISANMIMPHVAIPPAPVNFIFRSLMISAPQNPYLRLAVYQFFVFYQVIGVWGLFVYLLFGLMFKKFISLPYLSAGLIVLPLLTAFNPLTVDMMTRLGQDPAIYRFHYLIPLPFVAGYLFVCSVIPMPARHGSSNNNEVRPCHVGTKLFGSIIALAGLIGLVFPINGAGIYAPYSKIYTLRKIPWGNDYRQYDDLGKFMAKYNRKVILSDGWTAGFLWFYSPQNTYGWLTWFSSLHPEKNQPEPYTWENLSGRGLLIVNCRNGITSITGRISRHWPEDFLKFSRLYSAAARNYLESHPEKFRKIWSQNQIAVYAVQ
jgi:hypothetical protein